jgi:Uma2 family endonuclease
MDEVTKNETEQSRRLLGITFKEYLETFERQPVELVDGRFLALLPPDYEQFYISHRLLMSLDAFVTHSQLGRVFRQTPFWIDDEKLNVLFNVRIPDIAFIVSSKLNDSQPSSCFRPLHLVPDLVVEILRPNDKYEAVLERNQHYLRAGVQVLWLISPMRHIVQVFTPDHPNGNTITTPNTLSGSPILDGWSIPLERLFAIPQTYWDQEFEL